MDNNVITLNVNNVEYTTRPFGLCYTSGYDAVKEIYCSDFSLVEGATILVQFSERMATDIVYLSIEGSDPLPVVYGNDLLTHKDGWGDNQICEFYYEATEKGKSEGFNIEPVRNFVFALQTSEQLYFSLLKEGWKAQEARAILPNALKTELVMTGFVSDWKHFFELRDAGSAHPQARELAQPLHEEFIKRNYIKQ